MPAFLAGIRDSHFLIWFSGFWVTTPKLHSLIVRGRCNYRPAVRAQAVVLGFDELRQIIFLFVFHWLFSFRIYHSHYRAHAYNLDAFVNGLLPTFSAAWEGLLFPILFDFNPNDSYISTLFPFHWAKGKDPTISTPAFASHWLFSFLSKSYFGSAAPSVGLVFVPTHRAGDSI
jgi:hypothetical protein